MTTAALINHYINLLMIATTFVCLLFGGLLFYFLKVKKVTAREERVNYDTFYRRDSAEFVKFDNLVDANFGDKSSKFGVVVVNKYTFLAYLDIKGYDYARASFDEKQRTMINSVAFTNIISDTVTMRQSVKAIDLDHNIENQKRICEEYALKQLDLENEYQGTLELAEEYLNNDEMYAQIERRLKELQRSIVSTKWLSKESERILKYMKSVSSSGNAMKINQLVCSYTYNPNDYVEEMDENEIYMKACNELANIANNYASLLGNCGCRCRLLTGMEVLDLIRRHYHPFTCDDIKITDLFNSSYNALFVSSDSILKAERGKIGTERLRKMLDDMQRDNDVSHENVMRQTKEYSDGLAKAVRNYVATEG